ncbi:MAG: MoxR family ATPase [Pirellulaceae bacterium]
MNSNQLTQLAQRVNELRTNTQQSIGRVVVGLAPIVDQLLMAMIAGGHVLLEGVPGTAKTTLCRAFSTVLGIDFERVQFTPDLLPSDVTGTQVLDRQTSDFVLRKGPVFCQLLLADELNRAPARTQSSLLEAMQEKQVTIEGNTLQLPKPFMVLATQNPIEQEGVYRLPEAQLDRFLFRVHVGYPQREQEIAMLELHSSPVVELSALSDAAEIMQIQQQLDEVYCAPELKAYIIDLARQSRAHTDLILGASPRAAISLMKAGQAHALLHGRSFLTHEDIQAIALPVLAHRLIMRPESEMDGKSVESVVEQLIQSVPVLKDGLRSSALPPPVVAGAPAANRGQS